jgi:hypothetical protein
MLKHVDLSYSDVKVSFEKIALNTACSHSKIRPEQDSPFLDEILTACLKHAKLPCTGNKLL